MLLEDKKAKREKKIENLRDEPAKAFNFNRKRHRDVLFT